MTEPDNMTDPEMGDYIRDNYGSCALDAGCTCKYGGWKGQACQHWTPVQAFSWAEMMQKFKAGELTS